MAFARQRLSKGTVNIKSLHMKLAMFEHSDMPFSEYCSTGETGQANCVDRAFLADLYSLPVLRTSKLRKFNTIISVYDCKSWDVVDSSSIMLPQKNLSFEAKTRSSVRFGDLLPDR